ncbi:undecaprenyl-diphosphatase [Bacillus niameyensis]|uniref:undecaprenyl-diphosphatase n=1 Tax=Bacillus niameyensis TaxID=1522308 RepID=UPI000781A268|nr:undecaprenyl-diphosphatase [Bacillus niameyensis]
MNYELFEAIHQYAGQFPLLDRVMIFVTNKALIIYAITLLLMWIFGNDKYKQIVFFSALTGGLGLLLNFVITLFYFEPRPFVTHDVDVLIKHAADASFPSDHTTGAFSLALAILLRQRKIGLALLALAILTGVSRIFVGHHYPFDVLGSIIISIIVSVGIYKISPFLEPFPNAIIKIYNHIPFVPKKEEKSSM